ncbi:hypothetical protein SLEP1_g3096 [Rubroshorea leprosula]|uniref:Uncharacterized protein n=1 Tax=Rubroshorea leprosula TaxID=152421 RepID=A0AAV5HJ80_9ROSI|nr:hypothetical protein SLEP1_g3096 [Rubroshorea leprosula]
MVSDCDMISPSLVHSWDPSHECTAFVASRNWVLGRDRCS